MKDFKILNRTSGTYYGEGTFETYIVGFEDRPGGAEADQDFFDLIVELKRAAGSKSITVRIVQLRFDAIDVYLDGKLLASVRPTIEISIGSTQ